MAFCVSCGNRMNPDDTFCRVCGSHASATPVVAAPLSVPATASETSRKAIVSLICGLLIFLPPLFIAAIVFGHLALSEIHKSAGRLKGKGIALTGLLLGYLWIVLPVYLIIGAIAIPNMLRARMAANEASAVGSMRVLEVAEIAYAAAHPGLGYTCTLSDLAAAESINGSGNGPEKWIRLSDHGLLCRIRRRRDGEVSNCGLSVALQPDWHAGFLRGRIRSDQGG